MSVEKFAEMAKFYNQMTTMMSAICVSKGGIEIENYVGRFFAADVLQFIVDYGARLEEQGHGEIIKNAMISFRALYDRVSDMTTPSQKPIYEMTLEEFEKIMNI